MAAVPLERLTGDLKPIDADWHENLKWREVTEKFDDHLVRRSMQIIDEDQVIDEAKGEGRVLVTVPWPEPKMLSSRVRTIGLLQLIDYYQHALADQREQWESDRRKLIRLQATMTVPQ